MAFGANTTISNTGKAIITNRLIANTQPLAQFIGIGVGATGAARTAAPTDTALSSEVEIRQTATISQQTTDTTGDTFQAVVTITATGARAVDEAMIFDKSSSGNAFVSATFNPVNLSSGDSIQLTIKTKFQ